MPFYRKRLSNNTGNNMEKRLIITTIELLLQINRKKITLKIYICATQNSNAMYVTSSEEKCTFNALH